VTTDSTEASTETSPAPAAAAGAQPPATRLAEAGAYLDPATRLAVLERVVDWLLDQLAGH
jgi:hypothetical protein